MRWLLDRFRFAFAGVSYALLQDKSIFFQVVLGFIAIGAGVLLKIGVYEWLWIALSICLVLMAEIFNSCIEKTIDYISLERNEAARIIKDMAASAVFVTSVFALIVALVIFLPKVLIGK